MPLLPKLVGSIEIRERRERYPGEPRYKRLEFIKPKTTTDTDEWNVIHTSCPITTVQQYGPPWYHPQWPALSFQQQQQILSRLRYHRQSGYDWNQQQALAPGFHHHQLPPPPLQGNNHQLGYHDYPQRRIEHTSDHQVHGIGFGDGHGGNSDEVIRIEPRGSTSKARTPSRVRSVQVKPQVQNVTGYNIFESDSEDDARGRRWQRRRSIMSYVSDDSLIERYRQSRSRPRGHRGW